jgi:hypothetical protein
LPTVEEIQLLRLQVEGAEKLDRLNTELQKQSDRMTNLVLQLNNGAIGTAQYNVQSGLAAINVLKLREQIEETTKATAALSGAGGGGGRGGNGMGMLQLGYVMDDLVNTSGNWQRHLSSISNNMPGLLMSLGAGSGMAGMIGMIYTAAVGLAPVLKSIWDSTTTGGPAGAEALKKLTEEIKKTAEAYKHLKEEKTKAEGKGAGEIHEFMVESEMGVEGIQQAYLQAMLKNKMNAVEIPGERKVSWTDRFNTNLANALGNDIDSSVPKVTERQTVAKRIKERILAEDQAMLNQLMTGTDQGGQEGRKARFLARKLVASDHQAFPPGMLGVLENAEPAQQAAQAALEAEGEANEARAETAAKKREKKRADDQKAEDAAVRMHDQNVRENTRQAEMEAAQAEKARVAGETAHARTMRGEGVQYAQGQMTQFNDQRMASGQSSLSPSSIVQAAKAANDMFEKGLNAGNELNAAYAQEMERMDQLSRRAAQQGANTRAMRARASNMQGGGDNTGGFSLTPPLN